MYAPDSHLRVESEPVSCGLCLRPDSLRLHFACAVEEAAPRAALEHLRGGIATLRRGLSDPVFGAVEPTVVLADFRTARSGAKGSTKKKILTRFDPTVDPHRVEVRGQVRLALPADLDFWGRAVLVAALTELAETLRVEGERLDPVIRVRWAPPEARIAEPEAHRAALTAAWVERARALADAAESSGAESAAALHLRALAPPGAIEQRLVSLEEVVLELALAGHIDTLGPPPPPHRPS